MSWSGGQYSLIRALLAIALLAHFGQELAPDQLSLLTLQLQSAIGPAALLVTRGLGLGLALALLIGRMDRVAAFACFFLLPIPLAPAVLHPILHPLSLLVLVHALTPAAPFGSLAAAGRPDPAGDWQFPRYLHHLLWVYLGATAVTSFLICATSARPFAQLLLTGLQALACLLALHGRLRALGFLILAGSMPFLDAMGQPATAIFLVLTLMAFDPAWLPPQAGAAPELIFYDGQCGLCHRACRFVMAEDLNGALFAFAPLGGESFTASLSPDQRKGLPDSIVLLTAEGRLLTRSSALIHIGLRLGGLWRPLAFSARLLPTSLRDAVYRAVAAVRHRLFAKPKDSCPLAPPRLRTRFRA